MLGPNAYRTGEKDKPFYHQLLLDKLNYKENRGIKKYYPEDELFLFEENKELYVIDEIRRFYQEIAPPSFFDTIAAIKFPLILTIGFDQLLAKSFATLGRTAQTDYYGRKTETPGIQKISVDLPAIYNLFGSIEDDETMVLTHDNLYECIESLFGTNAIPNVIRASMKNARSIIFLGIPFDRWYMQLLMRLLMRMAGSSKSLKHATNQALTEHTRSFYLDHFRIEFIDENTPDFIETIYQRAKEKGLTVEKGNVAQFDADAIKRFIREGKLKNAIVEFNKFAPQMNQEMETRLTQIQSMLSRAEEDALIGLVTSDELTQIRARVTKALLILKDNLQEIFN